MVDFKLKHLKRLETFKLDEAVQTLQQYPLLDTAVAGQLRELATMLGFAPWLGI